MKFQYFVRFFLLLTLVLTPALFLGTSALPVAASQFASAGENLLMVVRIYYETADDLNRLTSFDVFEYNNHEEGYVLAAVTQEELAQLKAMGFQVEIDPEQTANFNRIDPLTGLSIDTISGYPCYRTVEETYQTAQDIATANPTLASWSDAGNSWEKSVGQPDGYDLMVLKLTNSALAGPKPVLFITASIHAREYTPAELTTRFAEYLVNNYNLDPDVTWLLDHHEIHLMFQANPDGRKEAEAGRSWRKNTNENYCGVTSTNRGADLNRNFSYQWGTGGSSTNPCDTTYRGPSPASEPETLAIQNYIQAIFSDQRSTGAAPADATGIYLDLHSAAGLVIWPWGYSTSDTPNASQLRTIGRKFAYFNGYAPNQIADELYIASGGSVDYSYGELGIASLAFELGTQFFQDCSTFTNTILPNNLPALLYAAKIARTPYMTSLGPDALSLAVSPNGVTPGTPVSLTATLNDTRYNNSRGTEPTQNIAGAEFYIDTPPWLPGAAANPMSPSDDSFNALSEAANATIDTTLLDSGRHTIFVRGRDASGNWGAVSAIFLTMTPTSVELGSFTVTGEEGAIRLNWTTTNELENVGFNLYRAETIDGPRGKINSQMIPSQVPPGSPFGADYEYLDTTAVPETSYYYWLEDMDIFGQSGLHIAGPVSALASQPGTWLNVYLPVIIKLH